MRAHVVKRWSSLINHKYGRLTIVNFIEFKSRPYFGCLCDCGCKLNVNAYKLISGHTKSCGCLSKELNPIWLRKQKGEAATNATYQSYQYEAKHRNLSFTLTKGQCINLFSSNCHYCGAKPSNLKKHKHWFGHFVYNGIDRKNNAIGYTIENCVACCGKCNFMKNSRSYDIFIEWVKNIHTQCLLSN